MGWWQDSAQEQDKTYLQRYMNTDGKDIAWDFVREAYKSVSRTSIMLLQVGLLNIYSLRPGPC